MDWALVLQSRDHGFESRWCGTTIFFVCLFVFLFVLFCFVLFFVHLSYYYFYTLSAALIKLIKIVLCFFFYKYVKFFAIS